MALPDSDRESTLEKVLNITTATPIIILTGLDDKDFALESLQKGAQDYLIKNELNEFGKTSPLGTSCGRHLSSGPHESGLVGSRRRVGIHIRRGQS